MKIKQRILIVLLLSIAFIPFSCKKYDDGPFISFRSVTKRLLGEWEVKQFLKGGDDLSQFYKDSCGCDLEFVFEPVISMGTDEQFIILNCVENGWNFVHHDSLGVDRFEYALGRWYFSEDKKMLVTRMGLKNDSRFRWGMYPLTISKDNETSFEIRRLTNKELWLRLDDSNNVYNIKLEKK